AAIVATTALIGASAPSVAQHHGGGGAPQWQQMPQHQMRTGQDHRWSGGDHRWAGRDDWRRPDGRYRSNFQRRDFDRWHDGHWFHGRHAGRFGWWWTLGDDWYAYDEPAYPYPDYDDADVTPPPVYYDPGAQAAAPVPPPPATQPSQPALVYDPYTN